MRALLARILGFDRTIQQLEREIADFREQLDELRWDHPFGMCTRGAFLQMCSVMPRGSRTIAFLDLDDVNGLNARLGYSEVNRRVRAAFSLPFRRSDIVARWYSGDEIVILFDGNDAGARLKLTELTQSAREQELSFTHAVGAWSVGQEEVSAVVERLSTRAAAAKKQRRGRLQPVA